MVTKDTKYNAAYHSNIPINYRQQMHLIGIDVGNNVITDEEIFNIWRDCYADDYESEGFEDFDDYVIELIECWIAAQGWEGN